MRATSTPRAGETSGVRPASGLLVNILTKEHALNKYDKDPISGMTYEEARQASAFQRGIQAAYFVLQSCPLSSALV